MQTENASVSLESNTSFENMNLNGKLMQAVTANRYKAPTEIQAKAIPIILAGQDLMASAETGAGKTVAFVLPILERLLTPSTKPGRGPRVLILTPTRELADQVTETIWAMSKFTNFKSGTITGGVPYPAQERLLSRPVDLLVATPGRLIDHMSRGRVDFSRLEILVLDEADRMLDMGFMADIERILEPLPANRQIVLFSATLEGAVQKIARRFLRDPVSIHLASGTKANASIAQHIHQADDFRHKRALLVHILEQPSMWQAIVFTATKRGAEELAQDLSAQRILCAPLHGDMKQSKRSRTLERMHRGQVRVLIATDVAARGLDVKKITHVVNFDMPKSVEDYVHRIGRTGRCGETGIAISLIGPRDWPQLAQIERVTGQRLERQVIEGLEPKFSGEPRTSGTGGSGGRRSSSGRGGYKGRPGGGGAGQGRADGQPPRNRPFAGRPSSGPARSPRFDSNSDSEYSGRSGSRSDSRSDSRSGSRSGSYAGSGSNASSGSKSSGSRNAGPRNSAGPRTHSGSDHNQERSRGAKPRYSRDFAASDR